MHVPYDKARTLHTVYDSRLATDVRSVQNRTVGARNR